MPPLLILSFFFHNFYKLHPLSRKNMGTLMYQGRAEGLYVPAHFRLFMERRKGVERVLLYHSLLDYSPKKEMIAVYHVSPQQVTVGYSFIDTRKPGKLAYVSLFGRPKAVREIEQIIREAEKRYQNPKKSKRA